MCNVQCACAQAMGGVYRVNGDLAVSRGFGDAEYKKTGGPAPEDRPVCVHVRHVRHACLAPEDRPVCVHACMYGMSYMHAVHVCMCVLAGMCARVRVCTCACAHVDPLIRHG